MKCGRKMNVYLTTHWRSLPAETYPFCARRDSARSAERGMGHAGECYFIIISRRA